MSDMIKVRVNKKIPPHAPGDVVSVEVDHEGTPLDHRWQRRFKDAKIDGCCEVIFKSEAKRLAIQKGKE